MGTNNMGVMFAMANEGNPQEGYFRMRGALSSLLCSVFLALSTESKSPSHLVLAHLHFFFFSVYGERVGIQSVEVRGSAGGGTGGNWTPLVRGWQGYFEWSGRGLIGAPFQVPDLTSCEG